MRPVVDERATLNALALAMLIVLAPVLSVAVPPLLDYPNHYARLWLLSGGINNPPLSRIYNIDWSLTWINSFIDLTAWFLGPLAGVGAVSKFVLALALLLPPIGVALLSRSLFGSVSWWNILCFVLCWNKIFLSGFINFEIGLGLALCAAAIDPKLALNTWTASATRGLIALLIMIVHPFGALFYFALLVGLSASADFSALLSRSALLATAARASWRVWPLLVALAFIVVFGPALPGRSTQHWVTWSDWTLPSSIAALFTYFRSYSVKLDALVILAFTLIIGWSAVCGRLRFHAGLVMTSIVLGTLAIFVPRGVMATSGIEMRLPSMAVLMLVASLRPQWGASATAGRRLILAALGLVLLRTLFVALMWKGASADLAAVRNALASVEAGAAVLSVEHAIAAEDRSAAPMGRLLGGTLPTYWHYPSLAVVDRHAFIPLLFTAPGKQPLKVLPPWKDIAMDEGQPPPVDELVHTGHDYMKNWRARFDYVLLLNADMRHKGIAIADVPGLTLVNDHGFARLYRITNR